MGTAQYKLDFEKEDLSRSEVFYIVDYKIYEVRHFFYQTAKCIEKVSQTRGLVVERTEQPLYKGFRPSSRHAPRLAKKIFFSNFSFHFRRIE